MNEQTEFGRLGRDYMDASAPKKRILILGGDFGGVYTAFHLGRLCNCRRDVGRGQCTRWPRRGLPSGRSRLRWIDKRDCPAPPPSPLRICHSRRGGGALRRRSFPKETRFVTAKAKLQEAMRSGFSAPISQKEGRSCDEHRYGTDCTHAVRRGGRYSIRLPATGKVQTSARFLSLL